MAGNGEDSDNNANDFVVREVSEPQKASLPIEDPSLVPSDTPDPDPIDDGIVVNPTYLPVYITEALPDPASPLSDAKDEFIELFNPNDTTVNLKGYTIRTGSNFKNFYTIGDVMVSAGGYVVFYAVDTKLGLTNSGGAVQLLDPLGNIVDATDSYGAAKTGQAWADINGAWNWTLEATPGAANILSEPAITTVVSSSTLKPLAKVAASKTSAKKTASKTLAKKTSKATTKKSKKTVPKTGFAATTITHTYGGIKQYNRNGLLWKDASVDGIKTGHTASAGYCLAASARRGDQRLISVVMGVQGNRKEGFKRREEYNLALLNYGFRFFETHRLYEGGKAIAQPTLWKGEANTISLGVKDDIVVTIPRGRYGDLKAAMDVPGRLVAPYAKGQQLGTLRVSLDGKPLLERPIVAVDGAPEGGFFKRLGDGMMMWFKSDEAPPAPTKPNTQ